jgi:hypothetical protein
MTEIKAAQITALFDEINRILGNGAGQNGYGQGQGAGYGPEIASYPVSNDPAGNQSSIVSAADINALFADMLRCRIHQVGPNINDSETLEEIAKILINYREDPTNTEENLKWNIVGLNSSFFIDNEGTETIDPDGDKKGIVDYEELIKQIELDKFQAHPSQMSVEPGITSSRTTRWNGTIRHEFTVSFRNSDHRRHFFNSGGEIRISANLTYTGTEAKTKDWQTMLSNIGTVKFAYNNTSSEGGGVSAASIGNYQLTSSYERIFTKQRTGGVYSDNNYFINAKAVDERQIRFSVNFADDDIGSLPLPRVDEDVRGNLESNVRIFRASSDISVKVPAPTFFNNVPLG